MIFLRFVLFFILLFSQLLQGRDRILVADSGNQPPFTIGEKSGLSAKVTDLLNRSQDKFEFVYTHLPSKRMRQMMKNGEIDMVAFDNMKWSWDPKEVWGATPLIYSKDQFIALKSRLKEQPFNQVGKSPIAVVNGFHYKFAGYKNDLATYNKLSMIPVKNETLAFEMVLAKRTLLGITSSSILNYFKLVRPKDFEAISIHSKPDHSFIRQFIVSNRSKVSKDFLDGLISRLKKDGQLKAVFREFGMEEDIVP